MAVSVLFAFSGAVMGLSGAWLGWIPGGFFALGIPVFLAEIVRPPRLLLNADGFAYRTVLPGSMSRSWLECGEFGTWAVTPKTSVVSYRTGSTDRPSLRRINRGLAGGDEGIREGFDGMRAAELADLMNRYRSACIGRG